MQSIQTTEGKQLMTQVAEETFTKAQLMDNPPQRSLLLTHSSVQAWIEDYQRVTGCTRDNAVKQLRIARGKQGGFTLIELLIVVAIILIIAAIAVPKLLSARTSAIEGKGGSTMRTVGSSLVGYNLKWGVFPPALTNLGGTTCDTTAATPTAACLMDDVIASQLVTPGVGQYSFTYTTTGGVFTLLGDPVASSSAKRHYFMDTGLTIHYNDAAPAVATDPTL